jgi:alkaline phosphatase D
MNLSYGVAVMALLAGACATDATGPEAVTPEVAGPDVAAIAPLPAGSAVLTRIAFGSCADEEFPQPIWKTIAASKPDLFLFMGDNIYVDWHDGEFVKNVTPEMISDAYEMMARHLDFSPFRQAVPIVAAWDDHDYGKNDGGEEFEFKAQSKEIMLDFFGVAKDAAVRSRDGLYHATTFGPEGRRVQIIMLDTRWFRSDLTPTDEWGTRGKERYLPSDAEHQVVLGEAQWAWLEAQLREPAELRLLVSSIQVISEGHGWELWRNLPAERQRFFELLRQTEVEDLVLLSGDRHVGGFYRLEGETGYPLYEVTSSSLNKSFAKGLTVPEYGPHQIGHLYGPENFGLITIDWEKEVLAMDLKDVEGTTVRSLILSLEDLKNRD